MANTKRNVGFRPYGVPLRATQYIANTTIYAGDLVVMASTGNVTPYTSSGTAQLGVAANYAAGQGSPVLVWDHPDQQFLVQSDGGTPSLQSDLFLNYQVSTTSGSAAFKVSRHQLTGSSQGTTATIPLKAIYLDVRPDNALGTYADVVVFINNHVYKGGTGTTGI